MNVISRALCAVSLVVLATGNAQAQAQAADPAVAAPATSDDWGSFGVQTQYIDTAVEPGDDFDSYVNGKWNQAFEIPADRTSWGSFIELRDRSEDRVKAILEEIVAGNPAPGTPEAKISAAWTSFMDTDAIEARGIAPAAPYINKIFAAKTSSDLMGLFAEPGFASPVAAYVSVDAKASDSYAMYISQGGLGLPDRDYYLVDNERNADIRAKYIAFTSFMLGKAGYPNPDNAAEGVYALEKALAGAMWDRAMARNRNLTYDKISVADLESLAPETDLAKFLATFGAGDVTSVVATRMPPTADELAADKIDPETAKAKLGGGLPQTLKLINELPVSVWQAWLTARFLSGNAAVLPAEIDDATFAFYGKFLSGQPEQRPRWKRAIGAVEGSVGELLGKVYADKYFPAQSKTAMDDLIANLRKAMSANLSDLAWMGVDTRAEAEAKLAAFTPKIGAPDVYKTYAGLELSPSDPLGNSMAATKWDIAYDLNRLDGPVDRTEWGMFPQTVNAYYSSTLNEIVFPAAILQPPFFSPSADPAVNYGGIGAVIGHEMGHGFDDQGSKSDGTGNLRNWWTDADRAEFDKLAGKLGAQYDALCPFDDGQTCVNGKLTMGENIGDLGGLSLAYRAYQMSLDGKPAPVIDGYTGDQRFFMAWAQVWRSKIRENALRQQLLTDPHSPAKYRINAVVRNFDEWYKAFDVKPDDALYLPPEQRVRIW